MRLGDLPHEFAEWTHDVDPWYGRGVEWALWTSHARPGLHVVIGTPESGARRVVYVARPKRNKREPLSETLWMPR